MRRGVELTGGSCVDTNNGTRFAVSSTVPAVAPYALVGRASVTPSVGMDAWMLPTTAR